MRAAQTVRPGGAFEIVEREARQPAAGHERLLYSATIAGLSAVSRLTVAGVISNPSARINAWVVL
jgi:hypothetical protein